MIRWTNAVAVLGFALLGACAAPVESTPAPEGATAQAESLTAHGALEDRAIAHRAPQIESHTTVDPRIAPDQLWTAWVKCPSGPPVGCWCAFDAGPVLDSYISDDTCQCQTMSRKPGTLTAIAQCSTW